MEPVSRQEIVGLFNEWLKKLEHATTTKDGSAISEGTRVVLSYALILWTHSPDTLTPEIVARMKKLFNMALDCINDELENGNNYDGCYDLYRLYIRKRLDEVNRKSEEKEILIVKYVPQMWEKIVSCSAALVVLVLCLILIIRNKPFADPNLVVLTRTISSLSVAIFGATVPGFLGIGWNYKGLIVRSTGAIALFVLSYLLTPTVL